MDLGHIGNDGSNALVHVILVTEQGSVHATIPNQNMAVKTVTYLDQPMQKANFVIARLVPVRYDGIILFGDFFKLGNIH